MSFFLEKSIKNRFPLWHEARRNDASNISRLIEELSKGLTEYRNVISKAKSQMSVLSDMPTGEVGHFWIVDLLEDEQYRKRLQSNDYFPELKVTWNEKELEEINNYYQIPLLIPDRIETAFIKSYASTKIATISNKINDLDYDFVTESHNIYFDIKNIDYYDNTESEESFDFNYKITIRGYDICDFPIEETIQIKDLSIYKTLNKFKRICSLNKEPKENIVGGKAIEVNGLKGEIEVSFFPENNEKTFKNLLSIIKNDKIRDGDSLKENYAFLSLEKTTEGSFLNWKHRYYEDGSYYRYFGKENTENFEEVINSYAFVTDNKEKINVSCWDYNLINERFVTVDEENVLRIHSLPEENFSEGLLPKTKKTNLVLEIENQKVQLGQTVELHVFLENQVGEIDSFFIIKENENEVGLNLDAPLFLQSDKASWGESVHLFKGNNRQDGFENVFSSKFEYKVDSLGEHKISIISFGKEIEILKKLRDGSLTEVVFLNELKSYLEKDDASDVYVYNYGLMSGYMKSERSFELPKDWKIKNILFQGVENFLYICVIKETEEEIYKVRFINDKFIYDPSLHKLGFLEEYDNLKIYVNDIYIDGVEYVES